MNLVALALAATTAFAGPIDHAPKPGKTPASRTTAAYSHTQYGETQKAGNGTIRSFVRTQANGKLTQVGVALSAEALNGLSTEMTAWVLKLPPVAANQTAIDHISFDWMPHGHEPDGVYNVPHFDCHFYFTTSEERLSIRPDDPRFAIKPDAAYLPAGYVAGPGVPQMGVHWIDPTSGEFQGKPFTTTFIFGALDGKVTFQEAMFTLDYLKQVKDERLPVKQPAKVAKPGLYPMSYAYTYNATEKQYEITLENLTDRK